MTLRSIILGLILAALVAGFGYINDSVVRLNFLVGNHFPVSVFGLLVIALLTVNPLLSRLRRQWRLGGGELATMIALVLIACAVPGSSMMRTFTPGLAFPIRYEQIDVGWRNSRALSYVPPAMLPNDGKYSRELMDGFVMGRGEPDKPIGLDEVPWAPWLRPLATWLPMLATLGVAVICLSLVVHRQWSRNERLRYPIAAFAGSLLGENDSGGVNPIFRDRIFWLGVACVLGVRVVNGLHAWYPNSIEVPLTFDFSAVHAKWPDMIKVDHGLMLLYPEIFPIVVAFAFFLASDVSLSLGLSTLGIVVVAGMLAGWGIDTSYDSYGGGVFPYQRFGGYVALGAMMLYTGRHYYRNVIVQTVTFRRCGEVEPYAAWAMRVGIVAFVALTVMLMLLGLDAVVSVIVVGLLLLIFLIIARLNAEAGLFFVGAAWQPVAVLVGLFGIAALGPSVIGMVALLGALIVMDPRECLMPFVVNGLKICDDQHVRPARIGRWGPWVFVMSIAVAVPVVLWANYNYGVTLRDTWATGDVPRFVFDAVDHVVRDLKLSGELASSQGLSAIERLGRMNPDGRFLAAAGAGLAAVLVVSVLRIRLTWWPLHPIIFLVWGSWAMNKFSASFLLGWAIKVAVTHLGGTRAYRRGLRLMVGVIAGDLLAGLAFMIHGAAYYGITGLAPVVYRILPD